MKEGKSWRVFSVHLKRFIFSSGRHWSELLYIVLIMFTWTFPQSFVSSVLVLCPWPSLPDRFSSDEIPSVEFPSTSVGWHVPLEGNLPFFSPCCGNLKRFLFCSMFCRFSVEYLGLAFFLFIMLGTHLASYSYEIVFYISIGKILSLSLFKYGLYPILAL